MRRLPVHGGRVELPDHRTPVLKRPVRFSPRTGHAIGAAEYDRTIIVVCREGVVESFDADTRSSRRRTLLSPRIEDVEFTDDSIDITFVDGDQRSLDPHDL